MIRVAGIKFSFHPLFTMIMLTSIITGYFVELITLFGVVFIHELGHVAAARGFGWRVKEVQFLPFGGVAIVDEQGTIPAWEEVVVSLAGPLQNAIMIGLVYLISMFGIGESDWHSYIIQVNMMIGLFNLLPILPLDGGKIMQALLSIIFNYYRAILLCTWLSLAMSVIVIIISVLQIHTAGIQLNLLVIGVFLLYANGYHLRNMPYHYIRFLMNREIRTMRMIEKGALALPIIVKRSKNIGDIVHLFMRERYHLIYVINELGFVQAVLPEQKIIRKYLAEKKPRSAVSELFM